MKDLLQIQEEIRRIEKLSGELSDAIQAIREDIMALREAQAEEVNCDYNIISGMAEQISLNEHPLEKMHDNYICRLYIEVLVNIVKLSTDPDMDLSQLGFIQWILNKSAFDGTMEDIVRNCHEFDKEKLNNINEYLSDEYKRYLLIDALMVININDSSREKALEFISSLCALFELDKEEVEACAIMSNIALAQNIEDIDKTQLAKILPYLGKVRHYIDDDLKEIVMSGQREIVMRLSDLEITADYMAIVELNDGLDLDDMDEVEEQAFEWEVKSGNYVKEGEVIARVVVEEMCENNSFRWGYWGKHTEYKWSDIQTPKSGYIYVFYHNEVRYAVISPVKDDNEMVKKWLEGEVK